MDMMIVVSEPDKIFPLFVDIQYNMPFVYLDIIIFRFCVMIM